ncbi:PASTA domain-containing protein [Rhodococcus koreensis]|uniref:PASTA domain-containing protein n=1 Tax=Rhodococcus koreensis TaxID=99653 RepID=A0A1H4I8N5_9NOCA|nr:PASTA domain-containing protein [Rhodococcus koreensis]SEB29108.1 PASTA domain-containing protein [Rhodococcus koreensis]SEB30106.1 PASTA domain-containing protein [Rhodococcus koreensis]
MAIASSSIPIDIPWRRIAFSPDMMDRVACDRTHPLRWRSSVTVFEYEPPADDQGIDGVIISYLKVSCSVTGYQPYGDEIQIRDRVSRSGWVEANLGTDFGQFLGAALTLSYPCYGAMLEVVVAPPEPGDIEFKDYPYFVDFDPKKREMYEQVTDTGEVMSRSLDDVNVRRGQTTLQSHEVRDEVSVGATAEVLGVGLSGGVESTTTDLSERRTENVRTTDAARESRETLSHTTQMSHMYQLLNSYHVGTNRAAFFIQPRPHMNQSVNTFVNGPRQIEGIQDFMLIVARPADQKRFCVEAYLETAHLSRIPTRTPDRRPGTLTLGADDFGPGVTERTRIDGLNFEYTTVQKATVKFPPESVPGYEVDTTFDGKGYKIESYNEQGEVYLEWDVQPEQVTLNAEITSRTQAGVTRDSESPASVDLAATIHLIEKAPDAERYTDHLFLTGRSVCSCEQEPPLGTVISSKGRLVYEKKLVERFSEGGRVRPELSIRDANRLSASIHQEMVQSINSPDRYPRNTVDLLDTQLIADVLGTALRRTDKKLNPRVADWSGDAADLARRVSRYAPRTTRAALLEIPLPEQVERFGLTFDEAISLRRALVDLPAPEGPRPLPVPTPIKVPRLTGRHLDAARATLTDLDLDVGAITEQDNSLAAGMVVAQDPEAGDAVEPGTQVALSISSGLSVVLPDVVGHGLAEAMCRLLDSGVQGHPSVEGPTGPDTRVAELIPQAGTPITPHAPVTLRMRKMRERPIK